MTKVKICGLSTPEAVTASIQHGADFIGFVSYLASPRHVQLEVAQYLAGFIPEHVQIVGLFVNPTDKDLQDFLEHVPLNMIQLHGDESAVRVEEIKAKFGLPVMKAISIANKGDLEKVKKYVNHCEWLLFDAKGETLPGGNGIAFDWTILKDFKSSKPWMLAGGLTSENIAEALSVLSPDAVDVSSGVEQEMGVKNIGKIASFLKRVKSA